MTTSVQRNAIGALRQFTRPREKRERCDFCGAELHAEHQHLLDPQTRQLMCACDGCTVSVGDRAGSKFRRVPRRARVLPGFQLDDALWDSLLIPVGMAFFFHSTPARKVLAFYPSPAGATESLLDLSAWEEVLLANPVLKEMAPDVEALLVNRMKGEQAYYMAPIDKCYELVGLIRVNWRGLSGGKEVWDEIAGFFTRLKRQAAPEPLSGSIPGMEDAHA